MLQSNVTLNVLSETGTGGFARGAGPLLRGEPAARQVPAPFAGARRDSPAWGEPARPGFPPEGETGKREIKKSSSLPQAFIPLMMTRQTIVANSSFLFCSCKYTPTALLGSNLSVDSGAAEVGLVSNWAPECPPLLSIHFVRSALK